MQAPVVTPALTPVFTRAFTPPLTPLPTPPLTLTPALTLALEPALTPALATATHTPSFHPTLSHTPHAGHVPLGRHRAGRAAASRHHLHLSRREAGTH